MTEAELKKFVAECKAEIENNPADKGKTIMKLYYELGAPDIAKVLNMDYEEVVSVLKEENKKIWEEYNKKRR